MTPPTFYVLSVVPQSSTRVLVTFNTKMQVTPAVTDPTTYSIGQGVVVKGAQLASASSVLLYTTQMTYQAVYILSTVAALFSDTGKPLVGTISFTGPSATDAFVVTGLTARSMCEGRGIRLQWTNPSSVGSVKIVRCEKSHPLDLTDPHAVVYFGPAITEFEDTGVESPSFIIEGVSGYAGLTTIYNNTSFWTTNVVPGLECPPPPFQVRIEDMTGTRGFSLEEFGVDDNTTLVSTAPMPVAPLVGQRASISSPLKGQTFYYYLVLVSSEDFMLTVQGGNSPSFDIGEGSKATALSIEPFDAETWLLRKVPRDALKLDSMTAEEGGGDGFLQKWMAIMACWLNTVHGHASALQLLADDAQAPYASLTPKILALGAAPEGDSYDPSVLRRAVLSLMPAYQKRGTCPGFVDIVHIYGGWDSECLNLGDARARSGASNLRTWDGVSDAEDGEGDETQIVQNYAAGTITFPTMSWAEHFWDKGSIRGSMGEVVSIASSNITTLSVEPSPVRTTTVGSMAPYENFCTVESTAGLAVGMQVQIASVDKTTIAIFSISSLDSASGDLTFKEGMPFGFPSGSELLSCVSILRFEAGGSYTSPVSGLLIDDDSNSSWVEGQWDGYKLWADSDPAALTVVSTSGDTLLLDGPVSSSGSYFLAKKFNGSAYSDRQPVLGYRLTNGEHSYLFDPVRDMQLRGTRYDPFFYLWQGKGSSSMGSWGREDIGIYVNTPVTLTTGRYGSGTSNSITTDPASPPLVANALVGCFLNPCQNQEQFFEIVANTETTITVAGNVIGVAVVGQFYYVLSARDARKFQRVSAKLREFASSEARPHLLFV